MKKLKWKFTCRKKGYSLIELVVSMAMLLIIGMVLTSILGISQKTLSKTYLNENVNSDISYALEYIKDEIASSEFYVNLNGNLYFVERMGKNYNYISFALKDKELYRFSRLEDSVVTSGNIKNKGANAIIDNISDFSISDEGNFFRIKIKYKDEDEISIKIAKRIKIYE